VDRNLSFQQHLPKYRLAVVLIHSRSNRLADLLPFVPRLLEAMAAAPKGSVTHVGVWMSGCGERASTGATKTPAPTGGIQVFRNAHSIGHDSQAAGH